MIFLQLKTSILISALAVLLFAGPSLASELTAIQRIQERGALIVAQFGGERLPFFMKTAEGRLDGFDVQLARDIAKELGVELEFNREAKSFDQVIDFVVEGKADLAISKLSMTLGRAQRAEFTRPYITLHQGLLISRLQSARKGRSDPMAVCNAPDAKIGVIAGTSYEGFAAESFPKAAVVPFPNFPDLLKAAMNSSITAILYDEMEIKKLLRVQPDIMLHLRMVVLEDRQDPLAMAVAPRDRQFRDWLNLYLDVKKIRPTVESLLDRFPPVSP